MATQSRAESLLNRVGQTPPLPADPDD